MWMAERIRWWVDMTLYRFAGIKPALGFAYGDFLSRTVFGIRTDIAIFPTTPTSRHSNFALKLVA